MNELLNVLLGMALAVAIVLGLAGLTGLIVGLYVWRRVDNVTAQVNVAFTNTAGHIRQVQSLAEMTRDDVDDLIEELDQPQATTVSRVH